MTLTIPAYLADVSRDDREFVRRATKKIIKLVERSVEAAFHIGKELIQVKAVLEHGKFLDWIGEEFEWGERTAQNLMGLALSLEKKVGKNAKVCGFGPSAMYLLTAPSAPDKALERAIEEAGKLPIGKKLKVARAKEIVEEEQAAEEAFEGLSPAHQAEIRQGMVTDGRRDKLAAIERHLDAARKLIEGEPDIDDIALADLESCRKRCRLALAG